MSSKEQFRDALKRENKVTSDLRRVIEIKDQSITLLRQENLRLKLQNIELQRKRQWWKFWKHL
jgi:hypothetical protein